MQHLLSRIPYEDMVKQVKTLLNGSKVLLNEFISFLPGKVNVAGESAPVSSSKSKEKCVLRVSSHF